MNREIKFRAWDIDNDRWIYSKDTNLSDFFYGFNNGSLDKKTLGQFIGRHDKNGNEVYEGDILRIYHRDKPLNVYDIKSEMETSCGCSSTIYGWDIKNPEDEEIIGNIFENPELLEQ